MSTPPGDAEPVVCTKYDQCLPADDVRTIHVTWTVSGQPASDTSCRDAPDLALQPGVPYDLGYGWAPIPCNEGKLTVDGIPIETTFTVLYRTGDGPYSGSAGFFDGSGDLALDLPY
ncbi:MAG TPA: hypothetical protein VGL61_20575 [Kofleriaceae bacterium]|jgi:hypothetical protein